MALSGSTAGLNQDASGLIVLIFTATKLHSLEQMRGIPCDILRAANANLESVEPVRGLRLVELDLGSNPALSDLSALAGMPLRKLNLFVCSHVEDLSPLHGMPLENLSLDGCGRVTDLGPLAGLPLRSLNVGAATDLRPLAGMPLESLSIPGGGFVIDLSPLAGLPLKTLNGTSNSKDLTPLLRISTLERLTTNAPQAVLAPLRKHPRLAFINYQGKGYRPVAEVWAELDAQQAAGKK